MSFFIEFRIRLRLALTETRDPMHASLYDLFQETCGVEYN